MPNADHQICIRHLYAIFRDARHWGVALKDKLWSAASAYTKYQFLIVTDELKKLLEPMWKYLTNIDLKHWSRAYFNPNIKSDHLVNNLIKIFNSYILKACDKPIITIFKII